MNSFRKIVFNKNIICQPAAQFYGFSNEFSSSTKFHSGYSFELNDSQKELKENARKFTREEILPIASHHDITGEFPWDIVKKCHKNGLLNYHIPKDLGGPELGVFDGCLIAEEFAYGCAGISLPLFVSTIGQIPVIFNGNENQKKKYLGRLIEEPQVAAFCVTEPIAGSDVNGIKTRAVRKGEEYILNGQKMWITNGGIANWYFVLARTNPNPKTPASEAFTGFIVDSNTPGITVGRKECNMGQHASDTRGISFEDVRVPKENVIVGEGAGFKIALKSLDMSRPCIAALSVGLAQRSLDEALNYYLEKKNDDLLNSFNQVEEFMLADMEIAIETSRLIWQKTAWISDNNQDNRLLTSVSKVYASEMAAKCVSDALKIFGRNGYNEDYPIAKLIRDSKILEIYEGTSQIQRLVISRRIIDMAKSGVEKIQS